jgi:hypothetical protein
VGDDIAWMHVTPDGSLNAINPENGFFGVAPGTSDSSNPSMMRTIKSNTIYTNVAMTPEGIALMGSVVIFLMFFRLLCVLFFCFLSRLFGFGFDSISL